MEEKVKEIIVVGKRESKKKYIILLLLGIILLMVFTSVILLFIKTFIDEDDSVKPTLTPVLKVSTTPATSVLPTAIITSPTTDVINLQKYIFPNCEVELRADIKWIPSEKGELGTCGILSTSSLNDFKDLNEFDGTLIAVLPFLSDSIFAPTKQKNYSEYLKRIEKVQTKYNPSKDFLYKEEMVFVGNKPGIKAEIYKAGLGMTTQIFFKGIKSEYIILWGGKTADATEADVTEVMNTIKLIQPPPVED